MGTPPHRLRKRPDGIAEKDPDTWGVITRIFDDYVNKNLGTTAIAAGLHDDGLASPGKKPWSSIAVNRILRNQMLVVKVLYHSVWLEGAHPPLLDEAVFDAAQRRWTSAAPRPERPAAAVTTSSVAS